ncbi:hypothetical protein [Flagellimonas sp.]|uniref:hypothetical protein n=1 Tax=Flagellimonas sp. TaxID=2058762 RepID=UPI003F4A44D3
MKRVKQIKGGALQFVLLVGTLIALILLSFILLHQTHTFFDKRTSKTIDLINKTDLGLWHAIKLSKTPSDSIEIQWDTNDDISVYANKKYWGVFEYYSITSKFKNIQFTKRALIGGQRKPDAPALYLKDDNRPMVICGNSKITGDAYLPRQGIKPGAIGGVFYTYTSPIFGQRKTSKTALPQISPNTRANIKNLFSISENTLIGNAIDVSKSRSYINSFQSETKYVFGNVIRLSNVILRGNIVVSASEQIIVEQDCDLRDVLLCAPRITIEDGFTGSLQAISNDKIKIGKAVVLDYPSALIVEHSASGDTKNIMEPNIAIGPGSLVQGVVGYLNKSDKKTFYPQIVISKNSSITGEVYCEKNLELKGSVSGTVLTNSFVTLENGNVYQNHLNGGTINSELLPKEYSGLLFNNNKGVVKWLY